MLVREVECKSILTKTTLKTLDFTLNPYFGCQYACVYCYCRFLCERFKKTSEPWGSFVNVKTNAVEVLEKELAKQPQGTVWLSSATDAYQPIEKKYELTRRILEKLMDSRLKVDVLTKGAFATRDSDIFKQFGDRIQVGFTINMLDDAVRRDFEPFAAPVEKRLAQLAQLRDQGIPTYASFGPVLPGFTDVEELFKTFKKLGITYTFTEAFNTRGGNWPGVKKIIENKYSELLSEYERIYFDRAAGAEWHAALEKKIRALSEKYGIKCDVYFNFSSKFK